MSGVTDEAFRTVAHAHGAGLVVSEMVASDALFQERPDMVRRAQGQTEDFTLRDPACRAGKPHWMAEGARLAQDLGADVIDINMGCPARQVTGGLSGSALMRDLDHAVRLIEATVGAAKVPVTVKMRLGWDHGMLNAPELAAPCRRGWRADDHRTWPHPLHVLHRQGGLGGHSRRARGDFSIPLVANGDGETAADARAMMAASGADAVMFGRSCYGRPMVAGCGCR